MEDLLRYLDGFAGLAALVNGLLLWPIVKTLKQDHSAHKAQLLDHGSRITKLEHK